jgi:hypothetical protein
MIILFIIIAAFNAIAIMKWMSDKNPHNCNNHEMYFEEEHSRGMFCNICHKTLSQETF